MIRVTDRAVESILQDVMDDYEDEIGVITVGQILSIVTHRAMAQKIYVEILPTKGGILLERVSLH